jgi:hypothetical protein
VRHPGRVGGQRELAGGEEEQSGVESRTPKVVHHQVAHLHPQRNLNVLQGTFIVAVYLV